jgi:hypothetical protein
MTTDMGERRKERTDGHEGDRQENMLDLAERVEQHYVSPSPQATSYTPDFFPRILDYGLLLGIFAGALLGAFFAWLLQTGRVTPEGWEGLFALTPFTYYAFWAFAGAAGGILVGGLATLLTAPVPDVGPAQENAQDEHHS